MKLCLNAECIECGGRMEKKKNEEEEERVYVCVCVCQEVSVCTKLD